MSDDKPRVRVKAATADSFQNFATRTGVGTPNVLSASTYQSNFLTLDRTKLEAAYRGSWVVGASVDVVAEDMTRSGISISGIDPTETDNVQRAMEHLALWPALQSGIKWGRLYGGAIGVAMVDGHNTALPLNPDTIGKDQFKGLMILDRWRLRPVVEDLITELGPNYGMPRFYELSNVQLGMPTMRIHYSRVIRFDGLEVPYLQRQINNTWGMSVVERFYDRLVAFDSATMGAAQLVHKAHLRTYAVDGLRDLIAQGGDDLGDAFGGLAGQIDLIRLYQSNEGMTLIDAADKFEVHQYAFGGLSDVIVQFAQQVSGALQIPLIRLLGQSAPGLNSTGDSDIRLYYDTISAQQNKSLRTGLNMVLRLVYRSVFGRSINPDFGFSFNPLWQMNATEKATIAAGKTEAILKTRDAGLISDQLALTELRALSVETGMWSAITDQIITDADDEVPDPAEVSTDVGAVEPVEDAPPEA